MHDTSKCLISLALVCKTENIVGLIVANWRMEDFDFWWDESTEGFFQVGGKGKG